MGRKVIPIGEGKKVGTGRGKVKVDPEAVWRERLDKIIAECFEKFGREDSSLMQMARVEAEKGLQKRLESGKVKELEGDGTGAIAELGQVQVMYLNMLAEGFTVPEACYMCGLDMVTPYMWEVQGRDGLFGEAMKIVREIETRSLESVVWAEASRGSKSENLKMFALKSRRPEYKDNFTAPTNVQTFIRVSLDGVPFDTSINYRAEVDDKDFLAGKPE